MFLQHGVIRNIYILKDNLFSPIQIANTKAWGCLGLLRGCLCLCSEASHPYLIRTRKFSYFSHLRYPPSVASITSPLFQLKPQFTVSSQLFWFPTSMCGLILTASDPESHSRLLLSAHSSPIHLCRQCTSTISLLCAGIWILQHLGIKYLLRTVSGEMRT